MKKNIFLIVTAMLFIFVSFAQEAPKYRRSSLHIMMMKDADLPRQDVIIPAFLNAPFPDKYDIAWEDGTVDMGDVLSRSVVEPTKEELDAMSKEDKALHKKIKGTDKKIEQYFNEYKIGNRLVAEWFNRAPDGAFDMDLIAQRGEYNATELDVQKAEMQSRSVSTQLADAGHELIGNTFIAVNGFNFIENEVAAALIYEGAKLAARKQKNDLLREGLLAGAKGVYERTRKGYYVGTESYLFKLNWSDSVQAIFYNNYWIDENTPEEEKAKRKELFDNSNLFQMEFIGMEKERTLILNLKAENMTQSQIIGEATVRSIDKVYSKLQKEYDVFKPKVPLYDVEKKKCSAKIGLKESLEGGEKFEVLEQTIDSKTGKTQYKSIGKLKVDKKKIWDNKFYVTQDGAESPDSGETPVKKNIDDEPLEATWFKGCKKKYYRGLLIRQLK